MLVLALKVSVGVLIFAIGLSATWSDVTYVWRRPGLLVRSLVAMYVVIPAVAVLMARALDLPWRTETAFVVLAICAGAPLLPKKLLKIGGDPDFIFSLVVTTSVLAIVTVPFGVRVLSGLVALESDVTAGEVAPTIAKAFLAPLGSGMLVRAIGGRGAEALGEWLLQGASVVLVACAVVLLLGSLHAIARVGLPSLLGLAAFTAVALATGHFLGGPDEGHRTSLAVASATRHMGLALLVAASYRGEDTLGMVSAYLLASTLVSLPYLRWRRNVHASLSTA